MIVALIYCFTITISEDSGTRLQDDGPQNLIFSGHTSSFLLLFRFLLIFGGGTIMPQILIVFLLLTNHAAWTVFFT